MEHLRELIEYRTNEKGIKSIFVDETKIDLYNTYDEPIPDWKPDISLPDWETVSVIYLDIETYSDNQIVFDSIRYRLKFGRLGEHDRPFFDFVYKSFLNSFEPIVKDRMYAYIVKRMESGALASADDYVYYDWIDVLEEHKDVLISHEEDICPKGALHPDLGKIVLIGVMNEKGEHIIFDCVRDGEKRCLVTFFKMVEIKKAKILAHFNGFSFDMPFIKGRCEHLRIEYPYYVSPYPTSHRTAQLFSKAQIYNSHWINRGETAIADLFHLVLQWDFTARKLTAWNLKQVPLQLGLRKEQRTELSYQEMKECVKSGDLSLLKEYLVYDLEDSKLIGDFLLPDTYYQQEINTTIKLQKLFYTGMGTKWNTKLINEYEAEGIFKHPEPDPPIQFQGGLTIGKAGFYKNIGKCDIGSQYPHAILLYGICSRKDKKKKMLGILSYQLHSRLELKAIAKKKKGTLEGAKANQRQGSKKIYINSGYGFFGTGGLNYNDYEAAALTTAIGRAILRKMMAIVESNGGAVVSVDTDGVFFQGDSLEHVEDIASKINQHMPKNHTFAVKSELEVKALAMYVPPSKEGDGKGLKKNYIYITDKGELKFNGKFVKRDNPEITKEITPQLVKIYYYEGMKGVKKYKAKIIHQLITNTYDVNKLSVTRKIKANEKKLVENGIGKHGEVKTFWRAEDKKFYGKKGQLLKKTENVYTSDPSQINWKFYLELAIEQIDEFIQTVKK